MDAENRNKEDNIKCPVCDTYFLQKEGFNCPKCKRGPLCKKHRVHGRRECISCIIDLKIRELNILKGQTHNIKSFLRLTQFVFLLFSVFFVSMRLGLAEIVEILQNNLIADSTIYLGMVSVLGYIIFYTILYNQRQKIGLLESEIEKIRLGRI